MGIRRAVTSCLLYSSCAAAGASAVALWEIHQNGGDVVTVDQFPYVGIAIDSPDKLSLPAKILAGKSIAQVVEKPSSAPTTGSNKPLVSASIARQVFTALKQPGQDGKVFDGCPAKNETPILASAKMQDSGVCLNVSSAKQTANGEIVFTGRFKDLLNDFTTVVSRPENTAACGQLLANLHTFAVNKLSANKVVPSGQEVPVAIVVNADRPTPGCDVHSVKEGG